MGNNSSHSEYGLVNRSRCSNFIPRRQYYQNRVTDPCGFNFNHLPLPMGRQCTVGENRFFRSHTDQLYPHPATHPPLNFGDSGYINDDDKGGHNVDKTNDDWTQVDSPQSISVTPSQPLIINPVTNTPRGYEPYNPFSPSNFIVNKVETETNPTALPSYTYLPDDDQNYLKSPESGDVSSSPSTPSLKSPMEEPMQDYEGPPTSFPYANPFHTPEIKKSPVEKKKSPTIIPIQPITVPQRQIKIPESFKQPIQIPNPSKPVKSETGKKPEQEPVKTQKNPKPKLMKKDDTPVKSPNTMEATSTSSPSPVQCACTCTPDTCKMKTSSLPEVVVEYEPVKEKKVVSILEPNPIARTFRTPENIDENPDKRIKNSTPTTGKILKPNVTPGKSPSKTPKNPVKIQPVPVVEIGTPSPYSSGNTELIISETESETISETEFKIIPLSDLNKDDDDDEITSPEIPSSPVPKIPFSPKATSKSKISPAVTPKLQVAPSGPSNVRTSPKPTPKVGVATNRTLESEPPGEIQGDNSPVTTPPRKPSDLPNVEIKINNEKPSLSSPKLDSRPSKNTKIPIKTGKALINSIPQKTPEPVFSIPPVNEPPVENSPPLKKDVGVQVQPEQLDQINSPVPRPSLAFPPLPPIVEDKGQGLEINPEQKEVETVLKPGELISENPSTNNSDPDIPSPKTPEETIQSFKNLIVSLSPVRTPTPSITLQPLRQPSSILSFDHQVIQVQPPMKDEETSTPKPVKTLIPILPVRQPSIRTRADSIPGKPKLIIDKEPEPEQNPMEGKPDKDNDNKDSPIPLPGKATSRRSTDNDDDGENRQDVPPQRQQNTGDDSDNNRPNSSNSTETPRLVDMYLEHLSNWKLPGWFWLGMAMLVGYYFGKTIGSCLTLGRLNRRICCQPAGIISQSCGCAPKSINASTCIIRTPQISSCKNDIV